MSSSVNLPVTLKRKIYPISLVFTFVGIISSYPISDIHQGNGILPQQYLGIVTLTQFSWVSLFMLLAWITAPRFDTIKAYRWTMAMSIAARLLLIPIEPYSSNDVSRYLFDGKLVIEGFDPYQVSHDVRVLDTLRTAWSPPDEHAKYVTLYPPLALSLFSFSAAFGISYAGLVWKILATLASITTLLMGSVLLKDARRLHHLPLLALSPIAILEAGVGAHVDAFTTLTVCFLIAAWQRKRIILCGILIGLGTLIKILPLVLAVPLVFNCRRLSNAFSLTAGVMVTLFLGYGLTFYLGFKPIGSLGVFFKKWRFGSPIFQCLEFHLKSTELLAVVVILLFIGAAIIACRSWKARHADGAKNQTIVNMQYMLALPLLLSPVIFPWYLMPLIPLVTITASPWLLLWLVLSPLSYEVLGQFACCRIWSPAQWPTTLIGIGLLLGILIAIGSRGKLEQNTKAN